MFFHLPFRNRSGVKSPIPPRPCPVCHTALARSHWFCLVLCTSQFNPPFTAFSEKKKENPWYTIISTKAKNACLWRLFQVLFVPWKFFLVATKKSIILEIFFHVSDFWKMVVEKNTTKNIRKRHNYSFRAPVGRAIWTVCWQIKIVDILHDLDHFFPNLAPAFPFKICSPVAGSGFFAETALKCCTIAVGAVSTKCLKKWVPP